MVFAGSVQRASKIRDLDMQYHSLKRVTPAVREGEVLPAMGHLAVL